MTLSYSSGYIGIVFENTIEFNKAAIALLMSVAVWIIYAGNISTVAIFVITYSPYQVHQCMELSIKRHYHILMRN
jgi:hypothetical protein